jgi:hypothetical protein
MKNYFFRMNTAFRIFFLNASSFLWKLKNTTTPEIRKKQPDAKISPFSLHSAWFQVSEKRSHLTQFAPVLLGD